MYRFPKKRNSPQIFPSSINSYTSVITRYLNFSRTAYEFAQIPLAYLLPVDYIQVAQKTNSPQIFSPSSINHLNAELNSICHLLALLGAHPILHISRIRVNSYKSVITRYLNFPRTVYEFALIPYTLHLCFSPSNWSLTVTVGTIKIL
jgi:hypothetical protein